jgi:hypothetical protein
MYYTANNPKKRTGLSFWDAIKIARAGGKIRLKSWKHDIYVYWNLEERRLLNSVDKSEYEGSVAGDDWEKWYPPETRPSIETLWHRVTTYWDGNGWKECASTRWYRTESVAEKSAKKNYKTDHVLLETRSMPDFYGKKK